MSISRGNCTNNICDMLRFPSVPEFLPLFRCSQWWNPSSSPGSIWSPGNPLRWDTRCEISSFLWEHPWSRVNRWHLFFSFPVIAFHFAFIYSHVPSILHSCPFILHSFPFILFSCPFMFRRYVSKIQVFENWYAQTGQVGIRPNARVFLICCDRFCYRLAIVSEACAGCHLQAWLTCTCISSLFFISFCFTRIVFWAGNALSVSKCKQS
jgi:hypothetical protein